MSINELIKMNNTKCGCGKVHCFSVNKIVSGSGVIKELPQIIKEYGAKRVFVLSDKNTYEAAGKRVCDILSESEIAFSSYSINEDTPEPDEKTVGSVIMHYDYSCDIIVAVGSGVINDTGKILAATADKPYIIVGTAPSMDGYASATSSMTRDGLKISLSSKCADVIIGDTDILKNAPMKMLQSGLGDMIAKYVSICEWRITNIITGEYYCEEIAKLVRLALKRCTDNAEGLMQRDEAAVAAVFDGLVICGAAMAYAGVSRPASGVEHYLSHIWDMRGVEFGTKVDLHGIQCAIGTLLAIKYYEKIKATTPDKEKALDYAKNFDFAKWSDTLRDFLGKGADTMIALEEKEQKYNIEKHAQRLDIILKKWDNILKIMDEELPSAQDIEKLLDLIGAPKTMAEIGIDEKLLPMTFKSSKDIRDKYVLSRLAWDLGIIEEL